MIRKKGTPAATTANKSGLSRVKRAAKNSPSSNADSELSDAESGSGDESDARTGGRGTPAARGSSQNEKEANGGNGGGGGGGAEHHTHKRAQTKREHMDDDEDGMDLDDDDAGDDKKYCLCQNVSFGDMVACDNDDCPYEWFHWSCVGLKSEPNGTWFCPVCTENAKKKK